MPEREWMTVYDPAKLRKALDYALALLFADCGPLPEPDVELAEQALSLVLGLYAGNTGKLREHLDEIAEWMDEHPGEWPASRE